ncbi:hypothetical protein BXZ70DRAFT_1011532 [Cristinia sonorae]|uniref:Uncharacterized protein n=1 Tax=Cristinia sonorae TaxID=1940300 RepID=A0A8K0UG93_9AGAR|nr:hypothetical protein BXZ70DRAFT_1011532 [Cristinia sonorae]
MFAKTFSPFAAAVLLVSSALAHGQYGGAYGSPQEIAYSSGNGGHDHYYTGLGGYSGQYGGSQDGRPYGYLNSYHASEHPDWHQGMRYQGHPWHQPGRHGQMYNRPYGMGMMQSQRPGYGSKHRGGFRHRLKQQSEQGGMDMYSSQGSMTPGGYGVNSKGQMPTSSTGSGTSSQMVTPPSQTTTGPTFHVSGNSKLYSPKPSSSSPLGSSGATDPLSQLLNPPSGSKTPSDPIAQLLNPSSGTSGPSAGSDPSANPFAQLLNPSSGSPMGSKTQSPDPSAQLMNGPSASSKTPSQPADPSTSSVAGKPSTATPPSTSQPASSDPFASLISSMLNPPVGPNTAADPSAQLASRIVKRLLDFRCSGPIAQIPADCYRSPPFVVPGRFPGAVSF